MKIKLLLLFASAFYLLNVHASEHLKGSAAVEIMVKGEAKVSGHYMDASYRIGLYGIFVHDGKAYFCTTSNEQWGRNQTHCRQSPQ